MWRCEVSPESGERNIAWFNFAPNGVQQWLARSDGEPGGWSEAYSWHRDGDRLGWTSRSGDLHYQGALVGSAIQGAVLHGDTHGELAGDFRCARAEGGPAQHENAGSAELDSPRPIGRERRREPPQPKPTPWRMVAPAYPEQALLQEVEGRVIVCFDVDTSGRVVEPVILESTNAVFNEPVLKALARSRYQPARDDGEAVASHSCRIFKFWLN